MTTIYVAQPQTELKIQSRQLHVFHQQRFCFAIPLNRVNQMVILGQQPWSHRAANLALSLHIPVVYFQPDGHCIEYLNPSSIEFAHYSKVQMQRSQEAAFTQATAESLVRAKLHNAITLVEQLRQSHPSLLASAKSLDRMLNLLQRLRDDLPGVTSLPALKTYEETASSIYHAALSRLLPDRFRSENLGLNPIRRLTNLGVALLSQRIQATLQTVGLDPEIGNLHADSITRPPLICDFLTEFQGPIVDTLVMTLLSTQQIQPDDFIWFDQGIFLRPPALETFIQQWDTTLSTTIQHLYVGNISLHQCLEVQAQEYIACLLEDETFYRPMLLKTED